MPYFFEINKGTKENHTYMKNILFPSDMLECMTGRKLEEMDIMVHCEITTFEWLMRWVKRNSTDGTSSEVPPKLGENIYLSVYLFRECRYLYYSPRLILYS